MSTSEFDEDRAEEEAGDASAVRDFDRLLDILDSWPEDRRDGLYWARRGVGLTGLEEYDAAQRALRVAESLGQDVRVEFGLVFEQLGRTDEAVELYREVLEDDPDNVSALVDLGLVEQKEGRLEDALPLLARAFALDETTGWQYGACLIDAGRIEVGVEALETAIAAGVQEARLERAMAPGSRFTTEEVVEEALASGQQVARAELVLHLTGIGELGIAERVGREGLAADDRFMYGPMAALLHRLGQEAEAVALNERAIETGDGDYLRDDA